jgi:hypothetical protein
MLAAYGLTISGFALRFGYAIFSPKNLVVTRRPQFRSKRLLTENIVSRRLRILSVRLINQRIDLAQSSGVSKQQPAPMGLQWSINALSLTMSGLQDLFFGSEHTSALTHEWCLSLLLPFIRVTQTCSARHFKTYAYHAND